MSAAEIVTAFLLLSGAGIMLIGAAGVLRFPDFYARLHASGKGDSLGQVLILVGLMIPAGLSLVSVKLALCIFFIFICNPTATHALARVAWRSGMPPLTGDDPAPLDYPRTAPLDDAGREAALTPVPEPAPPEEAKG